MPKIENNCTRGGLERDWIQVQVIACGFCSFLSKVDLAVCRCNRVDNCMYHFVLGKLILGLYDIGVEV